MTGNQERFHIHTCIISWLYLRLKRPPLLVAARLHSMPLSEGGRPTPPIQEGASPRLSATVAYRRVPPIYCVSRRGLCPCLHRKPLSTTARLLVVASPVHAFPDEDLYPRLYRDHFMPPRASGLPPQERPHPLLSPAIIAFRRTPLACCALAFPTRDVPYPPFSEGTILTSSIIEGPHPASVGYGCLSPRASRLHF